MNTNKTITNTQSDTQTKTSNNPIRIYPYVVIYYVAPFKMLFRSYV